MHFIKPNIGSFILLLFALFCSRTQASRPDPTLCYICNTTRIQDCNMFWKCDDGELCHLTVLNDTNGETRYIGECLGHKKSIADQSSGEVICSQCCHNDLCNNKLCGITDAVPLGTMECLKCRGILHTDHCNVVGLCSSLSEMCAAEYYYTSIGTRVDLGCETDFLCKGIGRKRDPLLTYERYQLCTTCCNGTACNRYLKCTDKSIPKNPPISKSVGIVNCPSPATTPTTTSTTTTTTTTSTTTTQPTTTTSSTTKPDTSTSTTTTSTTSATTTTPTSATVPVTTTYTTVPYRLTSGIECVVCSGGNCGRSKADAMSKCPDAFPYCMNSVFNDKNGNMFIQKRCASEFDCERLWWQESSSKHICSVFDMSNTYRTSFTCNYCCLTPLCNRDMHPAPVTLFTGASNIVTCEVCNGPTCDETTPNIVTCPNDQQNCLTHIKVTSTKEVTKRCASDDDCEKLWWHRTSDRNECISDKVSTLAVRNCTYCCTVSNCNTRDFPMSSMFVPK